MAKSTYLNLNGVLVAPKPHGKQAKTEVDADPVVLSRVEDPRIAALEAENKRLREENRALDPAPYERQVEETYRWMKTHAPGCHGLHDGAVEISDLIARLTAERDHFQAEWQTEVRQKHEIAAERDAAQADMDWLERWLAGSSTERERRVEGAGTEVWLCYPDEFNDDFEGKTLRQAIDAARKAGA